ncbi:MAG: hypothetical protein ACLRQ4_03175 [Neglectibacter timonensis]
MQVFIDAGLCTELYGPLYRHLFKTQPDGSPGIATLSFPAVVPEEAVRLVVSAGGKAVLAHPGQYGNFAGLPGLKEAGLWGVEASHPKHCPKDTELCLRLAAEYGLALTGGSDFHGRYGEGEELGDCGIEQDPFSS